jgi:NADH-quinone oxidoreductase subunit F
VLEGDPHAVFEGMAIGAYAIGAAFGYVYVRAEYPLALRRLKIAIKAAEERGLMGDNIMGSDFSFHIKIKEGAGAFVCGEETALMMSIEGNRGMPRMRPPFPAESGLWQRPTNINNVETLSGVPWIILNGAAAFATRGYEKSKGTKVFALAGKVNRTGLAEVPMGKTLREVIFGIGGGVKNGKVFKAVQMGGPSGGCLPESLLDLPVDYETINQTGAIVGSGGMIVIDQDNCIVDTARYFLGFTQQESCGKCPPCRIGTKRMLEILTKICDGKGALSDLAFLEEIAQQVKVGSLCGLGATAPNPILTALKYFREEFEEHVVEHRCRAGACQALTTYEIIPDACNGCRACVRVCPVEAITGERKEVHMINQELCIKCGACFDKCRFDAVRRS